MFVYPVGEKDKVRQAATKLFKRTKVSDLVFK